MKMKKIDSVLTFRELIMNEASESGMMDEDVRNALGEDVEDILDGRMIVTISQARRLYKAGLPLKPAHILYRSEIEYGRMVE